MFVEGTGEKLVGRLFDPSRLHIPPFLNRVKAITILVIFASISLDHTNIVFYSEISVVPSLNTL